ncbi:hypothetical protein GY45DRAFT_1435000 [Cubamyces sp. BRFM 1775]|nr:hypothetical protein GY45DRAFT_1435000 [Cubamyces sp. BRFM 1775]
MNTVLDFDGPAALGFRARHYEAQLKAQAARIIELEAKVAYLEKCLREANANMAGTALVLNAEPSSRTIRASASLHQAAEESCDMIGPSSSTGVSQPISKPATSIPSTGSAEAPIIPLVVEDSDNDDVPPPQPAESSRAQVPSSTPQVSVQSMSALELQTEIVPESVPHDPTRIQDRLVGIPRFIIPVPNSPVERFLVTKKGKNNFPSLSVPLRELLASRNYILPKLAFNPYLPPEPGCPGLLYQAHDRSKWEPGDQTVFIWLDYGLLRYVGEYSLELDGPMSKEEYQSWSPELKKAWAISILTMSAFRDIRTRILLGQQLGRRPNGKEVMASVRSRRFDNLEGVAKSNARAAIINAYERGNERMIIWRMKCGGLMRNCCSR